MTASCRRLGIAGVATLATAVGGGCSDPISLDWTLDLGAASASNPLVTEEFIAAGTETGVVIVEPDGSQRCRFDAHGEVISAPKTDGKLIYFGSTNYVFYAIQPDCEEAWKFPTRDRIKSDPLVAGGRVYLTSYDGHVYALNAKNGVQLWTFPDRGTKVAPPVEPAPPPPEPASKRRKKKRKGREPPPPAPAPAPKPVGPQLPDDIGDFSYSSPQLHDGILYVGNLDGRMYAIWAKRGKLAWFYKTDGPVTSTPMIHQKHIFFGGDDGNLYCVELATQRLRWKLTTKDWVNSSPTIADKTVYIGSNDRTVYAVDINNGRARWSYETLGPAISRPTPYKNLLFAAGGSGDGAVYALQREDGTLFWKFETGGKVMSDPVIVDDRLYITSTDQTLYAFNIVKTQVE